MRRRKFVGSVVAALLAWRLAAHAQAPQKLAIVGFLGNSSKSDSKNNLDAFRSGLRDLGYVDGQNVTIAARYADGDPERLPALAAELLALRPDVIVTAGPQAARALKAATSTVPIVLAVMSDPVAAGLATSLAHPGGNFTGLAFQNPELTGKRLEMLREAVPSARRIAVLSDTSMRQKMVEREALGAASALGFTAKVYNVEREADFGPAFQAIRRDKADAVIVLASPTLNAQRKPLVQIVAQSRLPASYEVRSFVDDGGLMSYGPSFLRMYGHSATYVAKILKGAKPADLPVEQPTEFELVINMRAANALGLTMPQSLLLRAEVIQ